jgi:hypothetical protein
VLLYDTLTSRLAANEGWARTGDLIEESNPPELMKSLMNKIEDIEWVLEGILKRAFAEGS